MPPPSRQSTAQATVFGGIATILAIAGVVVVAAARRRKSGGDVGVIRVDAGNDASKETLKVVINHKIKSLFAINIKVSSILAMVGSYATVDFKDGDLNAQIKRTVDELKEIETEYMTKSCDLLYKYAFYEQENDTSRYGSFENELTKLYNEINVKLTGPINQR